MTTLPSSRTLLLFAHRAEAQAFLRGLRMKPCEFSFDGVYQSENHLLLISGEGVQPVSERLSAVCAVFAGEIDQIINLGIAGSLDQSAEKGRVYSIRTVYAEIGGRPQYRSYTSACVDSQIDCITSSFRVQDKKSAAHLACFASIVDREAWACGAVATLFKKPFFIYKLISDHAGEAENCFDIREQAALFSACMFDFYSAIDSPRGPAQEKQTAHSVPEFLVSEGFHLTTTQRRRLKALLANLCAASGYPEDRLLSEAGVDILAGGQHAPKEKTRRLLAALERMQSPFNTELKMRIDALIAPLVDLGCKLEFARDYETNEIILSRRIGSRRDLDALIGALQSWPYDELMDLLNGQAGKGAPVE